MVSCRISCWSSQTVRSMTTGAKKALQTPFSSSTATRISAHHMDKPHIMNELLLLETAQLVVDRLLEHPEFCGSIEGRRLQELRREIIRCLPNHAPAPPAPRETRMPHLVTSTV